MQTPQPSATKHPGPGPWWGYGLRWFEHSLRLETPANDPTHLRWWLGAKINGIDVALLQGNLKEIGVTNFSFFDEAGMIAINLPTLEEEAWTKLVLEMKRIISSALGYNPEEVALVVKRA